MRPLAQQGPFLVLCSGRRDEGCGLREDNGVRTAGCLPVGCAVSAPSGSGRSPDRLRETEAEARSGRALRPGEEETAPGIPGTDRPGHLPHGSGHPGHQERAPAQVPFCRSLSPPRAGSGRRRRLRNCERHCRFQPFWQGRRHTSCARGRINGRPLGVQ